MISDSHSRVMALTMFVAMRNYCMETSGFADIFISKQFLTAGREYLAGKTFSVGGDHHYVKLNVSDNACMDLTIDTSGISFKFRCDGVDRYIELQWYEIHGINNRIDPYIHLLHIHLVNDLSDSTDPGMLAMMVNTFHSGDDKPLEVVTAPKSRSHLSVVK